MYFTVSSANIYTLELYHIFPETTDAVDLNEAETWGTLRDLLSPPDICRIWKWNNGSSSMGSINTLISSIILPSVMADESRIFPISLLIARNFALVRNSYQVIFFCIALWETYDIPIVCEKSSQLACCLHVTQECIGCYIISVILV